MLKDLKERTAIDRKNGIYSQIIQDERYVNYYFWKHGNDSAINIRMLGPSCVCDPLPTRSCHAL